MTDLATVGYAYESGPLKQAVDDLDRLADAFKRGSISADEFGKTLEKMNVTDQIEVLHGLGLSYDDAAKAIKKATDVHADAASAVTQHGAAIKDAGQDVDELADAFKRGAVDADAFAASLDKMNVTKQIETLHALGMSYEDSAKTVKAATEAHGPAAAAVLAHSGAIAQLGANVQQTGGWFSNALSSLFGYGTAHQQTAVHVKEHATAHGHLSSATQEVTHSIHALHPILQTLGVSMGELTSIAYAARGGMAALAVAAGGSFIAEIAKTGEELIKLKRTFGDTFGDAGPKMFHETEEAAKSLLTQVDKLLPSIETGYRSIQKARFEQQQEMRKSLEEDGHLQFAPGKAGTDAMWKMAQQGGYQFDAAEKTGKDIHNLIELFKALGVTEQEAGTRAADVFVAIPKTAAGARAAALQASADMTKLFEVSGKGADEATKATAAFFGEVSKGGLTASSFEKIASESNKAGRAIAEAFGFTGENAIYEFAAALEQAGSVSLNDLMVAINKAHEETKKLEVPEGVTRSWSGLKAQFSDSMEALAEGMGLADEKGNGAAHAIDNVTAALKRNNPAVKDFGTFLADQYDKTKKDWETLKADIEAIDKRIQSHLPDWMNKTPQEVFPSIFGSGGEVEDPQAQQMKKAFLKTLTGDEDFDIHDAEKRASEGIKELGDKAHETGEKADHASEGIDKFQTGIATIGAAVDEQPGKWEPVIKTLNDDVPAASGAARSGLDDATGALYRVAAAAAALANTPSPSGGGGGSNNGGGGGGSDGGGGGGEPDYSQPSYDEPSADVGGNATGGVYMIGASGGINTTNNTTSGTDSVNLTGRVSPGEIVAIIPPDRANSATLAQLQGIIDNNNAISIGGGTVSGGSGARAAAIPATVPLTDTLPASTDMGAQLTALLTQMTTTASPLTDQVLAIMKQLQALQIPWASLGAGVFAPLLGNILGANNALGGAAGGAASGVGATHGMMGGGGGSVAATGSSSPPGSEFDPKNHMQSQQPQSSGGSDGPRLQGGGGGASQESRAASGKTPPSVYKVDANGKMSPFDQEKDVVSEKPKSYPTSYGPDPSHPNAVEPPAASEGVPLPQPRPDSANYTSDSYSPLNDNGYTDYAFNSDSYAPSSPFTDTEYVDYAFNSDTYAPSPSYSPFNDTGYADYAFDPSSYSSSDSYGDVADLGANATGGIYTIGGPGTTPSGASAATGTDSIRLKGTVSPGEIVAVIPADKANQATMDSLQTMVNTAPVSIGGGNVSGSGVNMSEVVGDLAGPAGPLPPGLDPTVRELLKKIATIASPAFQQIMSALLGQQQQQQQSLGGQGGATPAGGGGGFNTKPSSSDGGQQPQQNQQQKQDNGPRLESRGVPGGASSQSRASTPSAYKVDANGKMSPFDKPSSELPDYGKVADYLKDIPSSFGGSDYSFTQPFSSDAFDYLNSPFYGGASDYYFDQATYQDSFNPFNDSSYTDTAFNSDTYAPSSPSYTGYLDYASNPDTYAPSTDYSGFSDSSYVDTAFNSDSYAPSVDIGENATGGVYTIGGPGDQVPGYSGVQDSISLVGNVSPGEIVAVIPSKHASKQVAQHLDTLVKGGSGAPQGLNITAAQTESLLQRIMALLAAQKLSQFQPPKSLSAPSSGGGGASGGGGGGGGSKPSEQPKQQQEEKPPPEQKGASQAGRASKSSPSQVIKATKQEGTSTANPFETKTPTLDNANLFNSFNNDPFTGSYSGGTNFFSPMSAYAGGGYGNDNASGYYGYASSGLPSGFAMDNYLYPSPLFDNGYGLGDMYSGFSPSDFFYLDSGGYNSGGYGGDPYAGDYAGGSPDYYNNPFSDSSYISSAFDSSTYSSGSDYSGGYNTGGYGGDPYTSADYSSGSVVSDYSGGGDYSDTYAATGGTFMVQGGGGTDAVDVGMHLNDGELVSVYSQDQLRAMTNTLGATNAPLSGQVGGYGGLAGGFGGLAGGFGGLAGGYGFDGSGFGVTAGGFSYKPGAPFGYNPGQGYNQYGGVTGAFGGQLPYNSAANVTQRVNGVVLENPEAMLAQAEVGKYAPANLPGATSFIATSPGMPPPGNGYRPAYSVLSAPQSTLPTTPLAAYSRPVALDQPDTIATDQGGSGAKHVSVNVFGVSNPQQFVQSRMAVTRAVRYV